MPDPDFDFPAKEFKHSTSYELFMLAVSLLSFVNLVLFILPLGGHTNDVILIVDKFTALLFFFDFLSRLKASKSRRKYFFREYGWSDLLASVPLTFFNIFRIFRVVRFIRHVRKIGVDTVSEMLKKRPADTALYSVFMFIILLLEFGSIGILFAESSSPEANIKTASDAIWWVFVSITTVGYGDVYPVTNEGRIIGSLTLTVGVGLFGVVTGYLANKFLRKSDS